MFQATTTTPWKPPAKSGWRKRSRARYPFSIAPHLIAGSLMLFHSTPIDGVVVIELQPRSDERGFFSRVFCTDEMEKAGLPSTIMQVNNSASSAAGTLR